jgi:hypothetical protein
LTADKIARHADALLLAVRGMRADVTKMEHQLNADRSEISTFMAKVEKLAKRDRDDGASALSALSAHVRKREDDDGN